MMDFEFYALLLKTAKVTKADEMTTQQIFV